MPDWFTIRIKTETKHINSVRANITSIPEEIFIRNHYQKLQSIGAKAANIMRREVLKPTKTGLKRKAKGQGEAGRIVTGTMYRAIGWRIVRHSRGHYTLQVGWLDGTPGYAIFQEQGVDGGVKAMEAVRKATEFVDGQLKALQHGSYTSTPTGFNEGNI